MEFYESISNNYDFIFPPNQAQVNFILRFAEPDTNNLKVLDIGCATGSLASALAEKNIQVWAFDFDTEMVNLARVKKLKHGLNEFPVFEELDMREINLQYQPNSFTHLVCFGNTLVHLQTETDIFQFLTAAHTVLQKGGKIMIQILNYNYILSNKINSLPLIENEHVRFERFYEFPANSKLINFKTILTDKTSGRTITNTVQLYPVRKNELKELLLKAKFQDIQFYGNFKAEPSKVDSLPLIVVGRK